MAAQRTAPELLFAVPEARQFRTAVHAEMLANRTRTHTHDQLVTHTLQKIKKRNIFTIWWARLVDRDDGCRLATSYKYNKL